jgi:amidase
MARTVADTALLLAVQSGPDPRVPMALDQPAPASADPEEFPGLLTTDLRGLRVAWSPDLGLPVEPEVLEVLGPARAVLAGITGSVTDTAPDLRDADQIFRTFRWYRASTFYAGLACESPGQLGRNMGFDVERGRELTLADLSRATLARAALAERVSEFLAGADVLACPVSQVAPFDVNLDWVHEINGQEMTTYLDWMASAYLISVTGLPAISVPAGFTRDGRPVGLQLVGRRRGDWDLLAVAHAFEAATGYAARVPDLPAGPPPRTPRGRGRLRQ